MLGWDGGIFLHFLPRKGMIRLRGMNKDEGEDWYARGLGLEEGRFWIVEDSRGVRSWAGNAEDEWLV